MKTEVIVKKEDSSVSKINVELSVAEFFALQTAVYIATDIHPELLPENDRLILAEMKIEKTMTIVEEVEG